MTLESLFAKEYENLKKEKNELEKKAKGLEIDLNQKKALMGEVADFFNKGEPHITDNGFLHMSYFLGDKQKDKAVELLKKLGVKIKEGEE